MARKESPARKEHHGFNDVIGIVLISAALLLLVALLSFDKGDLPIHRTEVNVPIRNRVGPFGAHLGHWLFFVFGAGAFLVPVLFIGFGLAYFFELMAYLRRRWLWASVLLVCSLGLLDLYTNKPLLDNLARNSKLPDTAVLERLALDLDAPSAGGVVGLWANKYLFSYFGRAGATIVFFSLYLISLLFLTNFRLGEWLRGRWAREAEPADDLTTQEKALDRRARELEKEAKALQEQVAKSGLGPDLQPVPEPTVRDLSISKVRPPAKAAAAKAAKDEAQPPEPSESKPEPEPEPDGLEVEVISAREIAAATTVDILGQKAEPAAKGAKSEEPPSSEADAELGKPKTAAPEPAAAAPPPRLKPAPKKPKLIAVAATPKIGNYQLPSLDFLHYPDPNIKPTESKEELMANARLMQQTLAQFDIEVSLGDITKGPTITRYELHPAPGVKLERITALNNNIAAALKAERIHILAPVPGKSSVGVEVPNLIKTKVMLRDLLESDEWRNTKARIPLALGKDVYGHPIVADLAEMPHLLIAGSTGSGKSVCINAIVSSLLYRFAPDQLRFVMIDPKVVELQQYNCLPHLVVPVVTDPKKVILALRWVVNEMEKRYQIFARVGVRNISSFNQRPKDKPLPKLEPELPLTAKKEKIEAGADGFAVEVDEEIVVPRDDDIVIPEKLSYVVVIIDELADLMLVAPADVEMAIARITQMARAAGIHVIVATQRPSVDVITGVIKANIPARIAFQVAAKVDSRTILDAMGADKLLGKGDMLYLPPGSAKLNRAQGALITDQEIQSIVDFISRQGKPNYDAEIHEQLSKPAGLLDDDEAACDEDEELIQQCIEVIHSEQKASVSLMQRRLRLGYTRAARIMDELERRGIVGPSKGAEPRDILIDLDGGGADGEGLPS
ncbi:MAG: DNA translocase FtsK [Verrucomicrobia bacterium]|nr:DNA translocase FtsK [Verrucomicrobiota bacterium]